MESSSKKNGPSDLERYVINNSPNNYPLEELEDNNTTSTYLDASTKAYRKGNNNSFDSLATTLADTSLETPLKNATINLTSSAEVSSSHLEDGYSNYSKQILTVYDSVLPQLNSTSTEDAFSTKNLLIANEHTTLPENTLEIIEVTQYKPANDDPEAETHTYDSNDEDPENESFSVIVSHISDELKVYSNEAMMSWEDVKEKAEKASEASQVLEDYLEKIRISQSTNNKECVKNDLENYERRKKELTKVVRDCENTIKRDSWKKLQKKTKKVLSQIYDIKERVVQAESKLSALNENTIDKRTSALAEARLLLTNINTTKIKDELSTIEKRCMKEDEDNLKTCINNQTEKGIIVDTLNDIMRIKNNCVG